MYIFFLYIFFKPKKCYFLHLRRLLFDQTSPVQPVSEFLGGGFDHYKRKWDKGQMDRNPGVLDKRYGMLRRPTSISCGGPLYAVFLCSILVLVSIKKI